MEHFWNSITDPQATIIAALITVLAAVTGVVLGWWLFQGKVQDLQSSVEQSDTLLRDHRDEVKATLAGIQEALGQIRGSVNVIESKDPVVHATDAQLGERVSVQDDWAAIRDRIEQIAADPKIDGRTRAKYARIDRRSYYDLIDALAADRQLGGQVQRYRQAVELYHKYRNGRVNPTKADVALMKSLRTELT